MSERRGDWMQTYTGKAFWPLDPRPDEVDIEDIAHSLSMQCRFAGHCREFYSVAEHSVRVSWLAASLGASREDQLWALLHDASEAYLVDLPRPVKAHVVGYKDAETRVMWAIAERFGLPYQHPADLKLWDDTMLATEARDLMGKPPRPWDKMPEPVGNRIDTWPTPDYARAEFLRRFRYLTEGAVS